MSDISYKELEVLLKGGKRAEIGETRTWAGQDYTKTANGWIYASGPNKGKKMGGVRSSKKTSKTDVEESKNSTEQGSLQYSVSESEVITKDGKRMRARGLDTGKPSKVPFVKAHNTSTNLIGQVAFGKASQIKQKKLNAILNDSDLILDELGIAFKQPLDFICQTLTGKRTMATFQSFKESYNINDRINIKSDSDVAKSMLHEIGHAVDYSLSSEGVKGSFFAELKAKGTTDVKTKELFDQLNVLLEEAPFYKTRSDKSYLKNPTEVFARAFEVYTYDKASQLNSEGKLSDNFKDLFSPDFLKAENKALKDAKEMVQIYGTKDESQRYTDLVAKASSLRADMTTAWRKSQQSPTKEGIEEYKSLQKDLIQTNAERKELYTKLHAMYKEDFARKKKSLRPDSAEVVSEISNIMKELLSTNKIKKALKSLDLKLNKSEESPLYYSVVAICCPSRKSILLGKRREDSIWTTPAGGADPGETPQECAVREAWEEAQIVIDPKDLISMGVKKAPNGKPVHIFRYEMAEEVEASVASDPDREVPEWGWYNSSILPKGITQERNKSRLETINAVLLQMHQNQKVEQEGIIKELMGKLSKSDVAKDAEKEVKGKMKDLKDKLEAKPELTREQMVKRIKKIKGDIASGPNYKALLDSLQDCDIKAIHDAHERKAGVVKKSVTNLSVNDSLEIDTSKFAEELSHANPEWLEKFYQGMRDFQYGDIPKEFALDEGVLYLSKVDDGIYSGFFKKVVEVEEGQLEDGSNIRIERQTIPTLVNFLLAKEWIRPEILEKDEQYQVLESKLTPPEEVKIDAVVDEMPMLTEPEDRTVTILRLLEKLIVSK